jgi:hypothetical protein
VSCDFLPYLLLTSSPLPLSLRKFVINAVSHSAIVRYLHPCITYSSIRTLSYSLPIIALFWVAVQLFLLLCVYLLIISLQSCLSSLRQFIAFVVLFLFCLVGLSNVLVQRPLLIYNELLPHCFKPLAVASLNLKSFKSMLKVWPEGPKTHEQYFGWRGFN